MEKRNPLKKGSYWLACLLIAIVYVLFRQFGGDSEPELGEIQTETNDLFSGMTETAAVELAERMDVSHRVVYRDGEDEQTMLDFDRDRVNFWIEDGVVVQALSDYEMTPQVFE